MPPTYARSLSEDARYYEHPRTGEIWPSVTTVLRVLAKPALIQWAANAAADYAVENLPSLLRLISAGRKDEARKLVATAHKTSSSAARDVGTAVHAVLEARARGIPEPVALVGTQPYVEAAAVLFAEHKIDLARDMIESEVTVVNRKIGYAGTADSWLRIAGKTHIVDYKTSSKDSEPYLENWLQVAALAGAETILRDNGDEEPVPKTDALAIVKITPTSARLYTRPLDKELFVGFRAALALWKLQNPDFERKVKNAHRDS